MSSLKGPLVGDEAAGFGDVHQVQQWRGMVCLCVAEVLAALALALTRLVGV